MVLRFMLRKMQKKGISHSANPLFLKLFSVILRFLRHRWYWHIIAMTIAAVELAGDTKFLGTGSIMAGFIRAVLPVVK